MHYQILLPKVLRARLRRGASLKNHDSAAALRKIPSNPKLSFELRTRGARVLGDNLVTNL